MVRFLFPSWRNTFLYTYILTLSCVSRIKTYTYVMQTFLQTMTRSKRQYSTTHHIEIAYKTKYKCTMCDQLLPPTFEIDPSLQYATLIVFFVLTDSLIYIHVLIRLVVRTRKVYFAIFVVSICEFECFVEFIVSK